ncbi:MAG TPA: PEP/pyruvate-binding domain-containing protein [Nitrospirales bacterium]|nr:PEP/pyruvate-binding domain-containing protein [Nitrospirales bacterium]
MKPFYRFDDSPLPTRDEVGGKGLSLMTLFQAGLPVPNGFVLTVSFFEPWIVLLKATPAWKAFLAADQTTLRDACQRLKAISAGYELNAEQKKHLREALIAFDEKALRAVRSSSPEEDLDSASFAGCYETVLGVSSNRLEAALHTIFASCLDARIIAYKRERGLDQAEPRIAIVVQEQVASEVSGVGFSKNPLNHNPDEAVFESNWGLGETVVSGRVSPDHFVVNKPSRAILERRMGRKERARVLLSGGGTHEREDPRHDQLSLQDGQIQALTEALIAVERRYGCPVDMEWAFAGGRLHILQARPIATPAPTRAATERKPGIWERIKSLFTS